MNYNLFKNLTTTFVKLNVGHGSGSIYKSKNIVGKFNNF